jgi:hypothetical protein
LAPVEGLVLIDVFVLTGGQGGSALPGIEVNGDGTSLAQVRGGGGIAAVAVEDSTLTLRVRNTTLSKNKDAYGATSCAEQSRALMPRARVGGTLLRRTIEL